MITPKKIQGRINIYSGEIIIDTIPVEINIETKPFTIIEETNGDKTTINFIIDNRGQTAKKEKVELDVNYGKTTTAPEIYTLNIPENDVEIYGYEYKLTKYDKINAKYKKHKQEVIKYVRIRDWYINNNGFCNTIRITVTDHNTNNQTGEKMIIAGINIPLIEIFIILDLILIIWLQIKIMKKRKHLKKNPQN